MQYFTAFDNRGVIVWQSRTARAYSRTEMIGTPAWQWVNGEDVERCKRALSTVIVTRRREAFTSLGTRDGISYEVTYFPLAAEATVIAETIPVSTSPLTDREMQVLQAICSDELPSETAKRLKLSVSTVESYRASLKRKLEAKGTAGLVCAAIRLGLWLPSVLSVLNNILFEVLMFGIEGRWDRGFRDSGCSSA